MPMNARVLLDSNVWIAHLMLRTNLGAALKHRLVGNPHSIVFPDVVRAEVMKHAKRIAGEKASAIADAYDTVASLLGKSFEHELPSPQDIQSSLAATVADLGPYLFPVSMSLEDAHRALTRVVDDRAPSAPKNQQFKDCVIWEIALNEAAHAPLHLVTDDRNFFEGRDPKQRMARALREDCKERGVEISLHVSLEDLLSKMQEQPQLLDEAKFESTIIPELQRHLDDFAQRNEFTLREIVAKRFSAFPTAVYGEVAVSFSFIFAVTDLSREADETSIGDQIRVVGSERFNYLHGTGKHAMLDKIDYMKRGTERVVAKSAQFLYAGNVQPSTILSSISIPTFSTASTPTMEQGG